jgi:hypothetical protein
VTRLALLSAVLATVSVLPASAQSFDGTYAGLMMCDAMSTTYPKPLRGPFKMTISGGKVTYERQIRSPTGQPTGFFERGTGSVNPSGAIALAGVAQIRDGSASTTYNGAITGGVARLSGSQNWTKTGERKCTIEARVSR